MALGKRELLKWVCIYDDGGLSFTLTIIIQVSTFTNQRVGRFEDLADGTVVLCAFERLWPKVVNLKETKARVRLYCLSCC